MTTGRRSAEALAATDVTTLAGNGGFFASAAGLPNLLAIAETSTWTDGDDRDA